MTSRWFLQQLTTGKTWLQDYLYKCTVSLVRGSFSDLLVAAIASVAVNNTSESNAIQSAYTSFTNQNLGADNKETIVAVAPSVVAAANKLQEESSILAVLEGVLDIVNICHKRVVTFFSLFSFLSALLYTVPSLVPLLRVKGTISLLINLYLNERSTEELKKCYGAIGRCLIQCFRH